MLFAGFDLESFSQWLLYSSRGIFRGGHGRDSIISIEYYAKLRHGPLLCNLGRRFENTNGGRRPFFWLSSNFGPKTELNLSEDLFFWYSPDFGQKHGLVENFLFWSSLFSNFPPPPFRKSCVRYCTIVTRLEPIESLEYVNSSQICRTNVSRIKPRRF